MLALAIPLKDFIASNYGGNNAAFASDYAFCRQNVKGMIEKGYMVIDGAIFRPMAYRKTK